MIYTKILDFIFPPQCVVCGQSGKWICDKCWNEVGLISTPVCYKCGKISQDFNVCQSCRKDSYISRFIICGYWQDPLKSLIYSLKYRKLHVLANKLGGLLAETYIKFGKTDNVAIVPVPLHRNRLWSRGFNQAQILADIVSQKLDIPVASVLIRTKNTIPQFNLSRTLRKDNIKDAFKIKSNLSKIKDKTVVLIDDLTTTGATTEECAKVLKNNGVKEVWALVLAKA